MIIDFVEPEHEGDGMNEETIRDHEEVTKVKNVNYIEVGKYRMETWYFSPIPKEYWPDGVIDTVSHALHGTARKLGILVSTRMHLN